MRDTTFYIGRRLINLFLVIWIAGSLNFLIPRLLPGDPVDRAFATMATKRGSSAQDVDQLKAQWSETLGLNAPLPVQYVNYWKGVLTLDLGISVANYPIKVTSLIASALPWTLFLLGLSTFIAFTLGTLLGALLAWPGAPRFIHAASPVFVVLSAMPYYLLAILLVAIFAGALRILPPAAAFSPSLIIGWNLKSAIDIGQHAILPSMSIILGAVGFWALGSRALMVSVLGEDFITYAEAKGLSRRRVFLRYGLRNALLPQVTALAIALGTVVSGAVLVEAIFAYPGLGGLLYNSIKTGDIFVINGIVTVLILTLGISVFIIDLALPILDPRIRRQAA